MSSPILRIEHFLFKDEILCPIVYLPLANLPQHILGLGRSMPVSLLAIQPFEYFRMRFFVQSIVKFIKPLDYDLRLVRDSKLRGFNLERASKKVVRSIDRTSE